MDVIKRYTCTSLIWVPMGPPPDILGFRRNLFNLQTDIFVKYKSTFEMSSKM